MKRVLLVKHLNNTELGRRGTHETYILIPQELELSDLFAEIGEEYPFFDAETQKYYRIRMTAAREKRIVGMGPYYREHEISAGDRVLLEKRIEESGECTYHISLQRTHDTVYFQKVKAYFEALTPNRAELLEHHTFRDSNQNAVHVNAHGRIHKRADSASSIKVYDIIVGEKNLKDDYQERDMIGLQIKDGYVEIFAAPLWKKYTFEVKST